MSTNKDEITLIESALIKEAEKRGFKNGVKYKSPNDKLYGACDGEFNYDPFCDVLFSNGIAVYNSGQWAEILPSKKKMTLKEIEEKLGYEIEITNA